MDTALIVEGVVAQVWRDCDAVLARATGAPEGGDLAEFASGLVVCGMLWDGETLTTPEPQPAAPPEQIPMHKAKKALVITGWMDAVQAAIDGIENPIARACTRIEFDTAPNLLRTGATTLAVMAAIGMTEEQRDEMIALAMTLP